MVFIHNFVIRRLRRCYRTVRPGVSSWPQFPRRYARDAVLVSAGYKGIYLTHTAGIATGFQMKLTIDRHLFACWANHENQEISR